MRLRFWSSLLAIQAVFGGICHARRDYDAHDYYAVHLQPGVNADSVASHLGLHNEGPLGELEDHYIFRAQVRQHDHDHIRTAVQDLKRRRRRREADAALPHILDNVLLSQKQELHKRFPLVKRTPPAVPPPAVSPHQPRQSYPPIDEAIQKGLDLAEMLHIKDPIFQEQWHLFNHLQIGHDINVTGLWQHNITGHGSTVCIVDDGLDMESDDLARNYFPDGSWDFNDPGPDPKPRLSDDRHGTRCAGEVAAVKNDVCGVGVAHDARIAGVRILSGMISNADEATAMNYAYQKNQIYSCSWGPPDNGESMEAPDILIQRAMVTGVQKGRQGLGSIYVFAIGNGAAADDNCNFDGYTNSIYSVSVGGIDRKGLHPYYSEKCSAQLVVTYSSGSGDAIHTTDVGKDQCYSNHGGTSAAGPLVAGIYALALQVNPKLTWRDIQYITALSAVRIDQDSDWQMNKAIGKEFSHQFGYGKADAWALVDMAKTWKNVKPQSWYFSPWLHVKHNIPQGEKGLASTFTVTEDMLKEANLERIEHVAVTMNVEHTRRGDLSVELKSPTGMVSHVATHRRNDGTNAGYVDWTFMSVAHWGESGIGKWTVVVKDTNVNEHKGVFTDWRLKFYGEARDASLAVPLPLPKSSDDDDHDVVQTETASVTTTTVSVPTETGKPPGNPDDHQHRPVNSKIKTTTADAAATTKQQSSYPGSSFPFSSNPAVTSSYAGSYAFSSYPTSSPSSSSSYALSSYPEPTGSSSSYAGQSSILPNPANPAKPTGLKEDDKLASPTTLIPTTPTAPPAETTSSGTNFLPRPFPTFGVSKRTQIWIYGALALILIFLSALTGWWYYMRRKQRRWMKNGEFDYGFEMVDREDADESVPLANGHGGMNGRGKNGGRKKRAGELYDAFAEGSEDEEVFGLESDNESDDHGERRLERYRDEEPMKEGTDVR